ncbi:phage tail protein, partial [Escherichia coli]|nr:phage tail protein [Escherichia coli]
AEKSADEVDLKDATTTQKGIVQLSSATDSESELLAATPKAVKRAMDKADDAVQRSGDTMDGELKLRGPDALRIFDDAFGVVFRRSDDCLYLIPTMEGEGENGAAGGLRPFIINLKTGKVSMKNGTDVEGALSVGGRLTVG